MNKRQKKKLDKKRCCLYITGKNKRIYRKYRQMLKDVLRVNRREKSLYCTIHDPKSITIRDVMKNILMTVVTWDDIDRIRNEIRENGLCNDTKGM